MLREALDEIDEGIRVRGYLLYLIRKVPYADDQATVNCSVEGLQLMVNRMQETTVE